MRKLSTTKLYIKQRKLKVLLTVFWQVVAPCLAVWSAIKHFRELRQHSAGGIIRDRFMVLMETHVVYFARYLESACRSALGRSGTLRDLGIEEGSVPWSLKYAFIRSDTISQTK
ncbi:hypothetical protein BDR06DRAFT_964469 [Suillus hirtellus]|nr:hypothetical protein BDR06DRAFT_964469 [Suillus hirtellus]